MNEIKRNLQIESEAARVLIANIRDVIGDDADAAADAVEGETSFTEACAEALARLAQLEAHDDGLKRHAETVSARRERLRNQAEGIRTALACAMSHSGVKKLETPLATISLRVVAPSVVVIDEAEIPATFWKRGDPKLDRKALLEALKDKRPVSGAQLSNGGETLAVRWA